MDCKWVYDGGILRIIAGEEVYVPSAKEIYSSFTSGINQLRKERYQNCEVPTELITINRFGKSISIIIDFREQDEKLVIRPVVNIRNEYYDVPLYLGKMIDHIFVDEKWYYLTNNHQQISDIFNEKGIDVCKPITLKKYMELKKLLEGSGISVEDKFEKMLDTNRYATIQNQEYTVNATLYPYQQEGLNWLSFMQSEECGCILGDEMGLGKTLQIISLLSNLAANSTAIFLVVAPVSLLENWKREIEKFAPSLTTYTHYGPGRTGFYKNWLKYDVVITAYSTVVSDYSILNMVEWDVVVLDEAQNIKNPHSKRGTFVKSLRYNVGIAVTGTPFENHMTDVWSIVDFVYPGYLGELEQFESTFCDDLDAAKMLEGLISPIIIRRRVEDVAKDLPAKIEIPVPLLMSEQEVAMYEEERESSISKVRAGSFPIDVIQGLRMTTTHPFINHSDLQGNPFDYSVKYQRLCQIVEEIIELNEKVIIFTSFNKMFTIIEEDFASRYGISVSSINGATPVSERQQIIDEYSKIDGSAVLVLNPRAAGTGLNITAANHVVHYNLEWNPALEDQSTARAFRRGQEKTVFVYKLFYSGSIGEYIYKKTEHKRDIFDELIRGNDGTSKNKDEIIEALQLSPFQGGTSL